MSLADYIRDDLRRRIRSGEDLSQKLSLAELARHYGVSFTPLRSALGALIGEGYVLKLPNRRLQPNGRRVGTGVASESVPIPPTPSDWDSVLLKEVTVASLSRRAAYLREESLARKLGVGRSIVRQALSRFAGAGLIEHVPRRGWLIHPLSEEDMAAYLVVRETLELKALELARHRLGKADIESLIRSNGRPGPRSPTQLDNRLHEYVIEKSGNTYIRRFFQQYVARFYTELFYHAAPKTEVVGQMVVQHRRILQAFLDHDWARARKQLSQHIRAQGPILSRLIEKEEGGP
jgi:DNA-binding GntR family transcriptional regulator